VHPDQLRARKLDDVLQRRSWQTDFPDGRYVGLPVIGSQIAAALAEAKLITISGSENGGAGEWDDESDRERHSDGAGGAAGEPQRNSRERGRLREGGRKEMS
jgi:hypothetical protein